VLGVLRCDQPVTGIEVFGVGNILDPVPYDLLVGV